jgi:hypothetical protein
MRIYSTTDAANSNAKDFNGYFHGDKIYAKENWVYSTTDAANSNAKDFNP